VKSATHSRVGDGGSACLSAYRAGDAQLAHQPLDRAASDIHALALELTPDLAGAVDAIVSVEHPPDLGLEVFIADRPRRQRARPRGIVGRRSELQFLTDRLDSERFLVGVDELN
jgi:hypothetical protein